MYNRWINFSLLLALLSLKGIKCEAVQKQEGIFLIKNGEDTASSAGKGKDSLLLMSCAQKMMRMEAQGEAMLDDSCDFLEKMETTEKMKE